MRIPVGDVDDPDNIIGVINHFLLKISPGQHHLYCKPASSDSRRKGKYYCYVLIVHFCCFVSFLFHYVF